MASSQTTSPIKAPLNTVYLFKISYPCMQFQSILQQCHSTPLFLSLSELTFLGLDITFLRKPTIGFPPTGTSPPVSSLQFLNHSTNCSTLFESMKSRPWAGTCPVCGCTPGLTGPVQNICGARHESTQAALPYFPLCHLSQRSFRERKPYLSSTQVSLGKDI